MSEHSNGWRSMDTAPRDGTVVELENRYGIAPWYGLFRWTAEHHGYTDTQPSWIMATDPRSSVSNDASLRWRPFNGDVAEYTDPTNGAQVTREYWLEAARRA